MNTAQVAILVFALGTIAVYLYYEFYTIKTKLEEYLP
jgi:hypothetical protein